MFGLDLPQRLQAVTSGYIRVRERSGRRKCIALTCHSGYRRLKAVTSGYRRLQEKSDRRKWLALTWHRGPPTLCSFLTPLCSLLTPDQLPPKRRRVCLQVCAVEGEVEGQVCAVEAEGWGSESRCAHVAVYEAVVVQHSHALQYPLCVVPQRQPLAVSPRAEARELPRKLVGRLHRHRVRVRVRVRVGVRVRVRAAGRPPASRSGQG